MNTPRAQLFAAALLISGGTGCATAGAAGETATVVVPLTLENNYLITSRCRRASEWRDDVEDPGDLGGNVLLDYGTAVQSQSIQYQTYTYSEVANVRAFRCPKDVLQQFERSEP